MRTARPVFRSTNVAATFPQSRNFKAGLPRRQPATTATASVTHRSISTYVTSLLRSAVGHRCRAHTGQALRAARPVPARRTDAHALAPQVQGIRRAFSYLHALHVNLTGKPFLPRTKDETYAPR